MKKRGLVDSTSWWSQNRSYSQLQINTWPGAYPAIQLNMISLPTIYDLARVSVYCPNSAITDGPAINGGRLKRFIAIATFWIIARENRTYAISYFTDADKITSADKSP